MLAFFFCSSASFSSASLKTDIRLFTAVMSLQLIEPPPTFFFSSGSWMGGTRGLSSFLGSGSALCVGSTLVKSPKKDSLSAGFVALCACVLTGSFFVGATALKSPNKSSEVAP